MVLNGELLEGNQGSDVSGGGIKCHSLVRSWRSPIYITLWVARILLGRLFHERLALGRTVRVFAKHYRKEVMHRLVKIQDLVDLAEPLMGGLFASMSMGQRRNDEMELDMGEEEQE